MTLPEVIISALILGISTQVSLQGWISTTARAARSEQSQQQLQPLDQQVLSAGRLLSRNHVHSDRCRFSVDVATDLKTRLPLMASLHRRLEPSSSEHGVWLELQLIDETSVLQRRVLFTPAGLGLCKEAKA
tara:strand:- start:554 stop:946 length:393 start_codon:yes stop_codon:yes gene_type:complete